MVPPQAFAEEVGSGDRSSDPRGVQCDTAIFKKSLDEFLNAGLQNYADEICFVLSAQEDYGKIDRSLMRSRTAFFRSGGGFAPVDKEMKVKLNKIEKSLGRAINGFTMKKEGVQEIPTKLVGQLQTARQLIDAFSFGAATGEGTHYGYDVDMVNQRMELALKYVLVWAREGFK
jgi:hypothetical protein